MANFKLWPCIKLLTNKTYSGRVGVCIFNDQPALAGESRSLPWTMSLSCLEPSSDSGIPTGSSPNTWPLGPLKLAGHSGFSPCVFQPHTPHCRNAKPPKVSPTSHDYSLLSAFAHSVPSSETPFPPVPTPPSLVPPAISTRLESKKKSSPTGLPAPVLGTPL